MARLSALPITLGESQRRVLEGLEGAHGTPQQLALRARIVLWADEGVSVHETARRLGVWPKTVRRWRQRWSSASDGDPDGDLAARLSDAPRRGTPAKFTPEQVCAIIAVACEKPAASGRAVSHWSQREVADEAMKRGLVDKISQRSVGRFFKRIGPQAASRPPLAHGQAGPRV